MTAKKKTAAATAPSPAPPVPEGVGEASAPAVGAAEASPVAPALVGAAQLKSGWVIGRLQVTSRRAGFRRAGRAWSVTPIIVSVEEFSVDQLDQLLTEPMLSVVPVADES